MNLLQTESINPFGSCNNSSFYSESLRLGEVAGNRSRQEVFKMEAQNFQEILDFDQLRQDRRKQRIVSDLSRPTHSEFHRFKEDDVSKIIDTTIS